ncbi:multiple epidermal growth factor-like domains protein 9 isoform X1 [Ictalurus furcatus]|uniref:multiple epidermal growth factor-like domains protein 9 isoform X1 n=2 Tax=Ictalurus furcatus TaxID=66913 RepID=UPI00234FC32B|nr:multiple epidermal growth factor-like domains protein 9 isoform X1 [Ictalurus furcatus]
MLMMVMMMMSASPAFSVLALVCLGWSCAHDAVRKPRQILSSGDANPQSSLRVPGGASFTGLTPAPTVLSADAHTTIEPPTSGPSTPSPARLGEDSALQELHQPRSARLLVQRRQSAVSDKAQDAGVITTSDNSQELVCNCSTEGVLDPDDCDRDTGQCVCMAGYTGLQCEECEEDHFSNGTVGCLPCGCDSFGAVGPGCDSSGTCVCKTGVYGPKCDDCHPGFFHFSSTGCQPCQCNGHSTYCHPQSGVCMDCQDNTQGQNCEECVPRYYRAPGGGVKDECVPCPCPSFSSSGTCHLDSTGHAVCDECKAGFAPPTCEVCTDGFYKSGGDCVRCECNGNADPRWWPRTCHPESGRCLMCANHTAGAHCELCASGYTGDALAHNCTLRAARLLPVPTRTSITTSPQTSSSTSAPPSSLLSTSSPASVGHSKAPPLRSGPGDPAAGNSTASALAVVSWTQFNVIVLAVIIVLLVLLMGFVGAVYTYREYRNRKLNAPFWTIELKEDNISFSSYHDSIPHAEPGVLLEEEQCSVPPNGQLALAAAANVYKA